MATDTHRYTQMEESNQITEKIIGCAYHVLNTLGAGFLEKVYENALAVSVSRMGLSVEQQRRVEVNFENVIVGEYFADLLIEGQVIVEIKAAKSISDAHIAQTLNYLKATGMRVALILNFGTTKLGVRRLVL
jgi:GxxExxY protein